MKLSTVLTNGQNPDFLKILEYGIKAPSGHNTQPWKFKVNENGIEVYANFDKELPVVDGNHRELYISLGCAVENICIAADEFGYRHETKIVQQDSLCFINIILQKFSGVPNPLFSQIDKRQTNRSVYKSKIISTDIIAILEKTEIRQPVSVYFYKNGDRNFATLAEFVYRGNEILFSSEAFKNELLDWMRFNPKDIQQSNDGLAYNVLGSPSLPKWLGKLIVGSFLKPKTQNKSEKRKIDSSSHLVLFTTKENTPENWILAGVAMERFFLTCSALGIAVTFLNQPCEVSSLAEELRSQMPINNEFPMLLLRMGYADPMPNSVRKTLDEVIIE
jgi:nitroreductase